MGGRRGGGDGASFCSCACLGSLTGVTIDVCESALDSILLSSCFRSFFRFLRRCLKAKAASSPFVCSIAFLRAFRACDLVGCSLERFVALSCLSASSGKPGVLGLDILRLVAGRVSRSWRRLGGTPRVGLRSCDWESLGAGGGNRL